MGARLIELNGPRRSIEFRSDTYTIGRAPESDIIIPDAKASRNHARIVRRSDGYHLEDMSSSNGTFFQGQRIREVRLQSGGVIKIASAEFRFVENSVSDYAAIRQAPDVSGGAMSQPALSSAGYGRDSGHPSRSQTNKAVYVGGAIFLVMLVLGASLFFLLPRYAVQSGVITTCSLCGKQISSTVQTHQVTYSDRNKYRVEYQKQMCAECGNVPVEYTIYRHCQRCGKIYSQETKTAPRRENPHDENPSEGYCSDFCRNAYEIEKGAEKVKQWIDDMNPLKNLLP